MAAEPQRALKHIFSPARFREIGALIAASHPGFEAGRFVQLATEGLEPLTLLQRMRHGTHALRATLPQDYPTALQVLRKLAPHLQGDFAGMMLPDYVATRGAEDFEASMDALAFLTRFSSAEFAIREFLRRDLRRTLGVMKQWSEDTDDNVRRLASEGSRPRLPWSFRIESLVDDPSPVLPIREKLRSDPSLYVRKSVANHLNDISKDHPDWMLAQLAAWGLDHPHTQWIARRAARSLIKAGHRPTLRLLRFTAKPGVRVSEFRVVPKRIRLGEFLTVSFALLSTARRPQRLVVDYRLHYVKASGKTSPKVFKLREVEIAPGKQLRLSKRQTFRAYTTRKHYSGRHELELLVNGIAYARASFRLQV